MVANDLATITEYYYVDRVKSGKYYAIPKKLRTLIFKFEKILSVIERELDRKYFGIDYDKWKPANLLK